jgi:3',5'-cyclic AMP phosphodiesterase CpdA
MKRFWTILLAAFLICGLFSVPAQAKETNWWEQDWWEADVLKSLGAVPPTYHADGDWYEIASPEQLLYLTGVWKPDAPCSATYVLTADLDMAPLNEKIGAVLTEKTGTEAKGYIPPIAALVDGDESEGVHCAFFGTFDGQGHAIKNLRVQRMGAKYCGLFGNVGHDFGEGSVKDLAILDAEIVGRSSCGILAGSLYGDADSIVCTGTIDCLEKNAGGLTGKIKKNDNGYPGIARNCFVYCDILVRGKGVENGAAGGITASCSGGGQVVNCFAGGTITVLGEEADSVGGIVGNLKGGTAIDNNMMALKRIDGGEDSQNIGFLCGNYGGDSGSHIHNNYVFDGTRLSGGVASSHPEAAAYTLIGADAIQDKAFYPNNLGWDFNDVWTWVGNDPDGYPMLKAFAGALDLTERLQADLAIDTPVLRLSEPMVNGAYAGETVRIEALLKLPEGLTATDATLLVGTSKKRSACTEAIPMTVQDGAAFADFTADEVGAYYYYCTAAVDGKKYAFPTEGTVRLDIVSPTTRYMPEQITLTPGKTVTEMCLNWTTEADGLTAELKYRLAGEAAWNTLPVTEIERVNVRGDHGTFTSYSVDLIDLAPATAYEYMAVTSDGTDSFMSPVYTFTTLKEGKSFSFVVVSDLQATNEEGYHPYLYTQQQFWTDTIHPDFVVNLGDLTEDDTMAEWSYLFDVLGELLAETPTVYVPGNHESKGDVVYSHFKGRTNLPDGIDDAMLAETTSAFTVGDVCFVTLNTEPYTGIDGTDAAADKMNYYAAQKAWAKEVFETSGCTYRIVCAHAGLVQKDPVATAFLEQMCDELDVDLFFNGHIHNYFRVTVDGAGQKAEPGEGTTFVTVSPMGTKFDDYGHELDDVLTFQTGGHDDERQYFAYVEVTEAGITVTAYQRSEAGDASKKNCSEYAAIDQFTVAKQTAAESAPEPAAPDAKLEKKGASPIVWVLIGVGAAAIVTTAVILILHKKKRGKAA